MDDTDFHVAALLDRLCVEIGFCLPPDDRARLVAEPPHDVDAFTDAVLRAEGFDPAWTDRPMRRMVRERVAHALERAFER